MGGKTTKFWLGAPFGRIGAALGFRWIMPIGTIPLPFHPLLAWLLPFGIIALVLYGASAAVAGLSNGVSWWSLLVAAAALAVPLAIPIVQWLAMAFRVPLLQALLIGGAMILLGVDAATGAVPPWAGAIPAAWLGLFILQRIGGPIYLRRLQASNAAFGRIDPGKRLVIVEGDYTGASYGSHLAFEYAVARVASEPDRSRRSNALKPQTIHRLSDEDWPAVAARTEQVQPRGWVVSGNRIKVPGIADPGSEPPLRVRMRRHRAPFWLIGGRREMLEIRDGARVHRLVGGSAELTGGWPLFTFFYYLNIFTGSGRAEGRLVAGFVPNRTIELGTTRFWDMIPRAFSPLAEAAAPPYADPAPLHAELDRLEASSREEDAALLERLLRLEQPLPPVWHRMLGRPELFAGRGAELCDCLAAAKEAKNETAVRLCAQLIAALPPAEFVALRERLLALLNSKALAFRLLDEGADLHAPEREKRKHVIGGFRLLRTVPQLYERLGELGEPARRLIMLLGELSRWQPPITAALETLDRLSRDARRPDN